MWLLEWMIKHKKQMFTEFNLVFTRSINYNTINFSC